MHLLQCVSPVLAQSRHIEASTRCPLLGVKRTQAWSPRRGTNRGDRGRRVGDAIVISHEVARVAISRRSRPFRQHRIVPGLPIALQTIEDFSMPIFQISSLTRVLDHIDEKFVPGDPQVFRIAIANGALRTCLIAPIQLARMWYRASRHNWS